MITKTRIIGGEVAAGVMTGMNVTGTVGETGTVVAEAEAVVLVLVTRAVGGGAMMTSVVVEAGADLWTGRYSSILGFFSSVFSPPLLLLFKYFLLFSTVAPLHDAVLVLERALLLKGVFPLKRVLPPGEAHAV